MNWDRLQAKLKKRFPNKNCRDVQNLLFLLYSNSEWNTIRPQDAALMQGIDDGRYHGLPIKAVHSLEELPGNLATRITKPAHRTLDHMRGISSRLVQLNDDDKPAFEKILNSGFWGSSIMARFEKDYRNKLRQLDPVVPTDLIDLLVENMKELITVASWYALLGRDHKVVQGVQKCLEAGHPVLALDPSMQTGKGDYAVELLVRSLLK